jgi:hypothetical protein
MSYASKLTTELRGIAMQRAKDMFRYEQAFKAHASVLRKDPARYATAYQEYQKHLGFMPLLHLTL